MYTHIISIWCFQKDQFGALDLALGPRPLKILYVPTMILISNLAQHFLEKLSVPLHPHIQTEKRMQTNPEQFRSEFRKKIKWQPAAVCNLLLPHY